MNTPNQPILFLWSMSPWASKVVHYLALRGIPYNQCIQPITMPRPDLAALGVQYRRVPVLAYGRDIYCDTLLILQKFENWYPRGNEYKSISATDPTGRAMEHLLEKWTDVAVFSSAAAAIPSEMDLCKDPQFQKDREELWGRPWTKEEQDRLKPAGLSTLVENFTFLEQLLSDGRQWLLGNDGPGLADVHAAWIFSWMVSLPNAMPDEFFGAKRYPATRAWLSRYDDAIAKAKKEAPQGGELEGPAAVDRILASPFKDEDLQVDSDPLGLKKDEVVSMWPIDTGYGRKDTGKLVKLTANEVAVATKSEQGVKEVRVHYPRWNYAVASAGKMTNRV